MVLLLTLSDDFTVQKIISWLNYLKKEYIVLNELNYVVDITMSIDGDCFLKLKKGQSFYLSDITSTYIRRGRFWFEGNLPYRYFDPDNPQTMNNHSESKLNYFIKNELKTL